MPRVGTRAKKYDEIAAEKGRKGWSATETREYAAKNGVKPPSYERGHKPDLSPGEVVDQKPGLKLYKGRDIHTVGPRVRFAIVGRLRTIRARRTFLKRTKLASILPSGSNMAKDWSKHSAQHFQGRETMKTTEDVMGALRDPKNWQDHSPPKGHDKHLSDSERAHSGQPGAKVKHGASAVQTHYGPKQAYDMKRLGRTDAARRFDAGDE